MRAREGAEAPPRGFGGAPWLPAAILVALFVAARAAMAPQAGLQHLAGGVPELRSELRPRFGVRQSPPPPLGHPPLPLVFVGGEWVPPAPPRPPLTGRDRRMWRKMKGTKARPPPPMPPMYDTQALAAVPLAEGVKARHARVIRPIPHEL